MTTIQFFGHATVWHTFWKNFFRIFSWPLGQYQTKNSLKRNPLLMRDFERHKNLMKNLKLYIPILWCISKVLCEDTILCRSHFSPEKPCLKKSFIFRKIGRYGLKSIFLTAPSQIYRISRASSWHSIHLKTNYLVKKICPSKRTASLCLWINREGNLAWESHSEKIDSVWPEKT